MNVLVTGSNGFLGAVLVETLLTKTKDRIRCLVRAGSNTARLTALKSKPIADRMEIFVGSLNTPSCAAEVLEGVDLVYHLAAGTGGGAADLFLNSAVASKHLLEAMVAHKLVKIVLISSFGVYGVSDLPRGHTIREDTRTESHPEKRDLYSFSKLRQEQLFQEYQQRHGFPLVILRPGVIYGPGGTALSGRIGVNIFGLFLHLGGKNLLPLSYVENCADAIVIAGCNTAADGHIYNVHDDNLPTCREYLTRYQREVKPLRVISVPYAITMLLSRAVEKYHAHSRGQMPAVFTPYKTAASWKGNRFDNRKLRELGWTPAVSTQEGTDRTFSYLRGTS